MIKRIVEVSQTPAHLSVRLDQLVLRHDSQPIGSVPCEDVGMVVVDHPQASYTHQALCRLAQAGAVVVLCGSKHLPDALILPLADHTEVVWRIRDQIDASKPSLKRLWQQIVQAKIQAQAANLPPGSPAQSRLLQIARSVRSGDPENRESLAARIYWQSWIPTDPDEAPSEPKARSAASSASRFLRPIACSPEPALSTFRRDTEGDGLNAFLNYGYAILRAAVARALVAAGLHPTLGLQHCNRSNPFCLADDLMEPLRPLVDRQALALWWDGRRDLDPITKAGLLTILSETVELGGETGPLMVALHRYAASLARCLRGEARTLDIPRPRPTTTPMRAQD
jgi:CRISPR-associated protein Cas1